MSNPPLPPGQHVHVYVQPQPTNGLGLAGFIVSLVGWLSCGLLSPVGLILSFCGLFKQPKGFAIAGTIIGALGSIFLVVMGIGIVLGILGIGAATKVLETFNTAQQASGVIVASQQTSGALPTEEAGNVMVRQFTDAWQMPLRYKPENQSYKIYSAGRDKEYDTSDDISFTREHFANPASVIDRH